MSLKWSYQNFNFLINPQNTYLWFLLPCILNREGTISTVEPWNVMVRRVKSLVDTVYVTLRVPPSWPSYPVLELPHVVHVTVISCVADALGANIVMKNIMNICIFWFSTEMKCWYCFQHFGNCFGLFG